MRNDLILSQTAVPMHVACYEFKSMWIAEYTCCPQELGAIRIVAGADEVLCQNELANLECTCVWPDGCDPADCLAAWDEGGGVGGGWVGPCLFPWPVDGC